MLQASHSSYLPSSPINDARCSLQETVFAMLVEITERAMAHVGSKEVAPFMLDTCGGLALRIC